MKKGKANYRETVTNGFALLEATSDGVRRVRGVGAVADVINANRRLYPADVLREAVRKAQAKLKRSLGSGHILGEADHPYGPPRLREVVTKWESIEFNETTLQVEVAGYMILTDAGRDAVTLMEAGILPGLSLRGYGESEYDSETNVETVKVLELTGFDLVFEPAFETAGITVFEQKHQRGEEMDPEDEKDKAGKGPSVVVDTVVDAKLAAEVADQTKRREAAEQALAESRARQTEMEAENKRLAEQAAELERVKREQAVAEAIAAGTRDLPYGEKLNARFVEAVKAAGLSDAAAVARFVAAKRAEYDEITAEHKAAADAAAEAARKEEAARRVAGMGWNGVVIGPVVETATGRPEFLEFSEQVRSQLAVRSLVERNERRAQSPAGIFTGRMLEAFDRAYRSQLIDEHNAQRRWAEAQATTDLNLPYSITRAIVAEAVPELVAANIFDFGVIDGSPTRVWFESYVSETGAAPTVTAEVITGQHDEWVAIANKWLRPGSVTLTNSAASTTYVENTDYRIDYAGGRLYTLSTGATTDAQSLKITYTYDAIATGEGGAIQRGKGQLSYQDVSVEALRLAALINDEASALGQTQLGWDAPTRAVAMLIREVREKIDKAIFYLALEKSLQSGNSGGAAWNSSSDTEAALVKKMGIAATAVRNDYYAPTAFLMSVTNADRVSNWTGFTREGFTDAELGSAGFGMMKIKALPVYVSTEMPDSHILVVNRELVQHRVLASRPMSLKGPFQFRNSDGKLTAQQEWFVEQYSGQWAFVANKGGYVTVS